MKISVEPTGIVVTQTFTTRQPRLMILPRVALAGDGAKIPTPVAAERIVILLGGYGPVLVQDHPGASQVVIQLGRRRRCC